ncbi:MAG TPA: ABC transporter permease [Solirubrobacteraceae bacterium]|jgi:ABC-2 type transport system permease protein
MNSESTVMVETPGKIRDYGPNAFGDDLRRFVNLTLTLANTDFKLTYFGSALGYVWSLMQPLLLFGVLLVVFTKIFHVGKYIPHYGVALLAAIIFWTFFLNVTTNCVTCLLAREGLLRKMRFPRLVIPLGVCVTALYTLGLNLVPVILFAILSHVYPTWSWLELPLLVLPLAMLAVGAGMILACLYVRFRDILPIWSVTAQILFYGSPVIYPALEYGGTAKTPNAQNGGYGTIGTLGHVLMCNPLAAILTQMRKALIGGPDKVNPSAAYAIDGAVHLLIPLFFVLAIFGLGVWFFNREAPRISENL